MSYAYIPLLVAFVTALPGILRAAAVMVIVLRAKTDDLPAIAKSLDGRSRQIGQKRKSG
ncbi:hypothetical protein GCM10010172_17600 [Paractinoplanes ferrugineus]|uniref:Uncharacterized protein n=1 Tax=Paractinoplanes ferrugineus TaxID=113564 RepID=A0A919J5P0_9ACTN|nr:hypothetical protein [Actinoplanes ferrugineus]GIE14950.1 hypothetical protein Afe05nite_67900 [Actinoplanes ferrugineus]